MSYSQAVVQTFIEALIAEKVYRGYTVRPSGLLEDCTGNVFTIELDVSSESVTVRLKGVDIL